MQTTQKTVRYYIDREADTPIIRTVPVSRPVAKTPIPAIDQDAGTSASHARHRLTTMVQAGVRKYRHRNS